MGQRIYIATKPQADLEKLNRVLAKMGIKNDFTTEQMNIDWLKDINTNPKSPQAHLKPADRDLTLAELQDMLGSWTTVGLLSFDVAFSRTSKTLAAKYLKFICAHANDIEYIQGVDSFIERFPVNPDENIILQILDKPEDELEELPADEQTHPDLQGGLYLCKSWSPQPFWVVFGNVESPAFLKIKKYKEDIYNNLYRDKRGRAYLLLPLLPLFQNGDKQLDFVIKVYNEAAQIGLRENFNFIVPVIYGLDLTSIYETAKDYMQDYNVEELRERFEQVFADTDSTYHYGLPQGFRWSDAQKRFKTIESDSTSKLQARCSVLTAIVYAMGEHRAAETMSKLTGKKYLPNEFRIQNLQMSKYKMSK